MKHYYLLLVMILLCSFLQDARSILSAGSGDDGEYGADTKSQIDNDNNSHSSSNNHIPLQEDSSGISATISNGGFLCESHVAKVQETAAIVTKARRRQEEQHREDDTSADEDWTGHTTSIDAIMLSHRQRQARLPINQNSNERWIHDDELDSGKTEFRQYRSDLMRLALCFHEKGAISKAFQIYQGELRRLFKDYAFPLVNIAHIHFRQGEPSKALNSLQLYFKEVEGTNVTDRDSLIFGTPCHSKALFLEDCISALNLLGLTYSSLYNHQGAMAAYNKALEIGENNNAILAIADIHENLGTLEYEMGKYESARAYFLRAFLARNVPRLKDADASKYLSTTDFTPFIQWALLVPPVPRSIEDAVGLSHAFSNSLDILEMLINQGGYRLEIHACERTSWQRTSNIEHEVEACLSIRPGQNDGTKQSSLQRVVLQYLKPQDIELLKSTIQGVPPLSYFTAQAVLESLHHFHIQFYGFHDRSSLERASMLLSKVSKPLLHPTSPMMYSSSSAFLSQRDEMTDVKELKHRRKTIVFVSCLFSGSEPHGQLVLDVIKRLPKVIFECAAVGIGSKTPGKNFLSAVNGKYYAAGHDRDKAAQLIMSLNPECIVYVENLNSPIIHFLAYERFAPIQILLMGGPLTAGIPSIDYFLSGDRLEHPFRTQASGDLSHVEPYTEQVVLFDGQAISFPEHQYHPPQDSSLTAGEAMSSSYSLVHGFVSNRTAYDEYNVPIIDGSIYMCFQNIFKMHPIFDSVILKVLHSDPKGHFVLQAARVNHKTNLVKERITKVVTETTCSKASSNTVSKRTEEKETVSSPSNHIKNGIDICDEARAVLSRIHFIPRVNSDQLTFLFQRATVVLHPFPFDGSKTASDVLGSGVPLVTFPQRYLRGRLASTFYATMALHEIDPGVKSTTCCVASDIGDYVSKVLRLGLDDEYRSRVANAIQQRKHRIYDDQETSFEWARFLTRALGVRVTDKDLARQMDYSPQSWQKAEFHSEIMLDQQRRWRRAKMEAHILSQ